MLLGLAMFLKGMAGLSTAYASPRTVPPAATRLGNGVSRTRSNFTFKIVDYYPARAGWKYMWESWTPAIIDDDFARIAALHANTVRVIVQVPAFGYPTPHPEMLSRLHEILLIAGQHRLRVELTLFDWWTGYTDIVGSRRWVRTILEPLAGDPRIAFVELQNEVDPANSAAMAWARQLIPYVRRIDGRIPVSLSVSGGRGIRALATLKRALGATHPDIYDLHYYGVAEAAYATFMAARQLVAPTPLINGETGFATARANVLAAQLPTNVADRELYQDQYFRTVEYGVRQAGLAGAGVWTLNDFAPRAIPPSSTARDPAQYSLGLYRTNGTAKPVTSAVRALFADNRINTGFNNGFESQAGGLPATWLLWHAAEAHFTWDPRVAHSGHASARIDHSGADSRGVPAFYTSPIVAVTPGHAYRASVWARGSLLGGDNRLALAWFDAAGRFLRQNESAAVLPGTTNWTQLSVWTRAPVGAASVQIHLKSANNAGTVWFDDVVFGMDRG